MLSPIHTKLRSKGTKMPTAGDRTKRQIVVCLYREILLAMKRHGLLTDTSWVTLKITV